MAINFTYITETKDLAAYVAQLEASAPCTLYIDTEFRREDTYYPELALLQINDGQHITIVDAVALGDDVVTLLKLLNSDKFLKVYHSAKQDVEIFLHRTGEEHPNVFDTQIAALFCGYGEQVALHKLVEDICGENLDKAAQNIDWCKRPLTDEALQYAASDVYYLPQIHDTLTQQLLATNRYKWVKEECETSLTKKAILYAPLEGWRRSKVNMTPRMSAKDFLRLTAIREEMAQKTNVPRGWLFNDTFIEQAVKRLAKDNTTWDAGVFAQTELEEEMVAELVNLFQQIDADELAHQIDLFQADNIIPEINGVYHLAKFFVQSIAQREKLPPSVIATTKELKFLIHHYNKTQEFLPGAPLLKGWRWLLAGKPLTEMLRGELPVKLKDGILTYKFSD